MFDKATGLTAARSGVASRTGEDTGRVETRGRIAAVLAVAAILLSAVPFTPPSDAIESAGRLTLRALLESGLLVTGVLLAGVRLRSGGWKRRHWFSTPFLLITAFCGWAVLSARWSPSPNLTVVKSVELWLMLVAAVLVAPFAARAGLQLARRLAAALLLVLALLVAANLVMWRKPLPVVPWETLMTSARSHSDELDINRPRLLLAYGHPLLTSDLIALATLALIAARPKARVLAAVIPVLAGMMWLEDARGPLVGTMVGCLALVAFRLRGKQRAALVACAVLLLLAATVLKEPADAGPRDASEEFQTLNGRTELWIESVSLAQEHPLRGWGYFATRFPLLKDFDWAGNTHNWALELLLGLGVPGLAIGLVLVLHAFKLGRSDDGLLVSVTLYGLIHGMLDPVLFVPGPVMFVWLCALVSASAARYRHERVVAHMPAARVPAARYRRLAPAR